MNKTISLDEEHITDCKLGSFCKEITKYVNNSLFNDTSFNKYLSTQGLHKSVPRLVEIRIVFIQIGEVDTINEKFQAIIKTKAKWFDAEIITEYDTKKHWNPKLFIENALHEKFKEEISHEVARFFDKTIVTETRISKGTFWERMELNDFPLDIQELSINLLTKHKPNVCKLISDKQGISSINSEALNTFRDQQKFKLYRLVKVSETSSYETESSVSLQVKFDEDQKVIKNSQKNNNKVIKDQPQANKRSKFVATCFCSRRPGYYIKNVYSFNFLITVLSLTLFVIDTKLAQNRISGTFTLILTSFSFKVVTSKTLPAISYLTSLDKYQIINIVYLTMCCVWHSICASLDLDHERKFFLDKIVLCCFATFFILIQVFFIVSFMKSYQNIRKLKMLEEKFISETDLNTVEELDFLSSA